MHASVSLDLAHLSSEPVFFALSPTRIRAHNSTIRRRLCNTASADFSPIRVFVRFHRPNRYMYAKIGDK